MGNTPHDNISKRDTDKRTFEQWINDELVYMQTAGGEIVRGETRAGEMLTAAELYARYLGISEEYLGDYT